MYGAPTLTGTNFTSLPGSQVGSGVPAANIAAGPLGPLVIASSLTATGVGAGSCMNCNLTYNAEGQLTVAANGTGGSSGASALAVTTGSSTGWTGQPVSSPTAVINLSSNTFTATLEGSATAFIGINFSSITAQGPVVSSITASALTALTNPSSNLIQREIGYAWDGGGSALTTGTTYWMVAPATGTITAVVLTGNPSGSVKINVSSGSAFGFSTASSICASDCPALSSATSLRDTTLTGWTTAIAKDEVLYFVVNSATTLTQANLTIEYYEATP